MYKRQCKEYALSFVDKQREQFKRLGVLGEWDDPYLTLKPAFEAKQVEIFGKMAEKGFIYKGMKPVYWCPHDPVSYTHLLSDFAKPRAAAPAPAPEAKPVPPPPVSAPPAPEPEAAPEAEPWAVRGELFHTYILVEQGERAYFIDKHAAHERMNFDRLKACLLYTSRCV